MSFRALRLQKRNPSLLPVPETVLSFVLKSGEHQLARVGDGFADMVEQLLHCFSAGEAVCRAGRLDDRELELRCHVNDVLLRKIGHGANLRDAAAGQEGFGVKGVDTAFIQHGQQKRFQRVVAVMSQRQLVGTQLPAQINQRAAAHLGA